MTRFHPSLAIAVLTLGWAQPVFADASADAARPEAGPPSPDAALLDAATGAPDARPDAAGAGGQGSAEDSATGAGGAGSGGRPADGAVMDSGSPRDAAIDAAPADATGEGGLPLPGTSALSCGPLSGTVGADVLSSCDAVCAESFCVPASVFGAEASQLPDCANGDKCVPRFLIETRGQVRFKACHSVGNAEGRCVPACLPQIGAQAGVLPQDTCLDVERCLPCFNPVDGTDNGVCSFGCDPGPAEPATRFDECCGGSGVCGPSSLVAPADRAFFGTDTCTGAGELCIPKDPAAVGSFACLAIPEAAVPDAGGPLSGGSGGASGGSGGAAPALDAGPDSGSGFAGKKDESGCGCRTASSSPGQAPGAGLALGLAVAVLRLRRRRRTRG